jgi:hypothetical protein
VWDAGHTGAAFGIALAAPSPALQSLASVHAVVARVAHAAIRLTATGSQARSTAHSTRCGLVMIINTGDVIRSELRPQFMTLASHHSVNLMFVREGGTPAGSGSSALGVVLKFGSAGF